MKIKQLLIVLSLVPNPTKVSNTCGHRLRTAYTKVYGTLRIARRQAFSAIRITLFFLLTADLPVRPVNRGKAAVDYP